MQEWVPVDISLKRQSSIYINRPEYQKMLNDSQGMKLMNALNDYALKNKSVISGSELIQMRKALVNAITRKVTLVSGSNMFMTRTKTQALDLIEYYNKHKE